MATAKKNKSNKSTKTAAKKAPETTEVDDGKVVPIKKAAKEKKEKLPWLKGEAVKWSRLYARGKVISGRLSKAQDKKHSPDLVDAIEAATKALALVDEVINTLSDGEDSYAPAGRIGGGGKSKADVGDIVCLTEKGRAKYADLLEDEELKDLEVLKVKGSMLIVRATATKEKFKIPRGQVRVQEEDGDDTDEE